MAEMVRETSLGPVNGACDPECRALWLGIVAGGPSNAPNNGAQAEIMRTCQATNPASTMCGYDGLPKETYPRIGHPDRHVVRPTQEHEL